MTDELRQELYEAKTFALAAPVIKPLLTNRRQIVFELLMRDFREGITDFTTKVAELNVLYSLEKELDQKELHYRTLEERLK